MGNLLEVATGRHALRQEHERQLQISRERLQEESTRANIQAARADREEKRANRGEVEKEEERQRANREAERADSEEIKKKEERQRAEREASRANRKEVEKVQERQRANKEAERADNEKAEKEQERKRANREAERADSEKAKKEQERQRANREAAEKEEERQRANREAEKADSEEVEKEEARQWANREKAEKEKESALRTGRYYNVIDDTIYYEEVEFSGGDLDKIRRKNPHPFYLDTVNAAGCDPGELRPAHISEYDPGSSLSEHTGDKEIELTRKRKLKDIVIDGQKVKVAEVAHLIPHSGSCAHFFAPIVEAAVGVNVKNDSTLDSDQKDRKRLVLVHGQYDSEGNRVRDTGIKHCRTNMALVSGQKQYLDFNPSMLIVPLLSLGQTLEYEGGAFTVLVLCTSAEVYRETQLTNDYELCSEDELAMAIKTLRHFVTAAAYTLQCATEDDIRKRLKNPDKDIILLTLKNQMLWPHVKVPVRKATTPEILKLIKLTFDLNNKDTHHKCDPFLLFVKAAVVWSSIQGQKLLPGSLPPHNCDECLAQSLVECSCDAYDPILPIPEDIYVI